MLYWMLVCRDDMLLVTVVKLFINHIRHSATNVIKETERDRKRLKETERDRNERS